MELFSIRIQRTFQLVSTVLSVRKSLCYQKRKHRESDTPHTAHRFIQYRAMFQQVIGTMVYHHRKNGNDFQCATAQLGE